MKVVLFDPAYALEISKRIIPFIFCLGLFFKHKFVVFFKIGTNCKGSIYKVSKFFCFFLYNKSSEYGHYITSYHSKISTTSVRKNQFRLKLSKLKSYFNSFILFSASALPQYICHISVAVKYKFVIISIIIIKFNKLIKEKQTDKLNKRFSRWNH
jgi:hypothetical protein